jgi:sugar lactone lactonase YvrE
VIGQSSFAGSAVATNSTSLWYPPALAFDSSGNLWVADYGSNRVLEYEAPFSTHEAATLVIGQPNFATKVQVTNSTQLDQPNGLAFDPQGNLWVSDSANDRVLEFSSTVTTPEFPAVAVPIVLAVVLMVTLVTIAPQRRYRQL